MNYVTIYEVYKHKFYQLPQVFFTNDKYKNMSIEAKVAWSLLYDRSSLSRKNEWFDEETGRIYFIYTNEELMKMMNIKSKTTISNIKKQLRNAGLIETKKIGFNRPDKIYIIYPNLEKTDIYRIDKLDENDGLKVGETYGTQGSPYFGRPEYGLPVVQEMDSINTDYNNTELIELDTNDTEDLYLQTKEIEKIKQDYFNAAFFENEEKLPLKLGKAFSIFCRNAEEAERYYKVINQAKLNVFEDALEKKGITLLELMKLENDEILLNKIVNTFVRVIRMVEQKGSVENTGGYLYKAIYRQIWDYFNLNDA